MFNIYTLHVFFIGRCGNQNTFKSRIIHFWSKISWVVEEVLQITIADVQMCKELPLYTSYVPAQAVLHTAATTQFNFQKTQHSGERKSGSFSHLSSHYDNLTAHLCKHSPICVMRGDTHVDLHMCPSSLHLFPTGSLSWPPHSHQSSTHFYPGQPPFEGWVINVPSDTPSGHRGSLGGGRGVADTHAFT